MMKKITAEIRGAAMNITPDSFQSIVTAMTAAPMMRKGALTASLMNIFTPFCTVLVSLVRRLTSEDPVAALIGKAVDVAVESLSQLSTEAVSALRR